MTAYWHSLTNWFHGLNLGQYWSFKGLFALAPDVQWRFMWVYVGLVGLCFVGGILMAFLHVNEGLKQRLSPLLWTNFWLGIFLFFFRWQSIPLIGMDLWRFLQEVAIIVWVLVVVFYRRKQYPKEVLAEKAEAYRNRFLPKKKN